MAEKLREQHHVAGVEADIGHQRRSGKNVDVIRSLEMGLVTAGDADEAVAGRHVDERQGGVQKGGKQATVGSLIVVGRIAQLAIGTVVQPDGVFVFCGARQRRFHVLGAIVGDGQYHPHDLPVQDQLVEHFVTVLDVVEITRVGRLDTGMIAFQRRRQLTLIQSMPGVAQLDHALHVLRRHHLAQDEVAVQIEEVLFDVIHTLT